MTEQELTLGINSAYQQALKSFNEGGVPVGSALMVDSAIVALGHNQRFQRNSNILHGEMDCIENAGHSVDFSQAVLFTTLSPCMMCTNTILLFNIPRVVILDNHNTSDFVTSVDKLKDQGVEVSIIDHQPSMDLNRKFQTDPESRKKWMGDVGK